MKAIRLFFQMLFELKLRSYELRKDYWKYREELEIYKCEKLKQIHESYHFNNL